MVLTTHINRYISLFGRVIDLPKENVGFSTFRPLNGITRPILHHLMDCLVMFGGCLATDVEEATDEVGHTVADAVMGCFKVLRGRRNG